jgi:hypothetical protein
MYVCAPPVSASVMSSRILGLRTTSPTNSILGR